MAKIRYKYIYGPVPSWRLGRSLGIDPISATKKACTFDCIYCQLGSARPSGSARKIFVPIRDIIKEVKLLPDLKIDYITFSGTGEPTLAKNLGELIKAIKGIRGERIAILTNSSLIGRRDVQKDLLLADYVVAKLDAPSEGLFAKINKPAGGIKFGTIVKAIKDFKAKYKGKLALQLMFIKDNKEYAKDIAKIVKDIAPDEVQINTPLRPCNTPPLSRKEIAAIKAYFKGINILSVYDAKRKKTSPLSEKDTKKRRGIP